jgi:hypothetical protein
MKPIVLIILLVLFFIVRTGSGYASNKPVYPSLSCDCSKTEIDILQMRAYWDIVDANEYDYIQNISEEDTSDNLLQFFEDYAKRRREYDLLMSESISKQGMIQLSMNNYKMAKSYYKINGDPTNNGTLKIVNNVNKNQDLQDVNAYYSNITNEDQSTLDPKIQRYKTYINTIVPMSNE